MTEQTQSGQDHLRHAAEAEREIATLEKKIDKLEESLHAAQAANRAKSTFLSNMSHDIRTPMNAIVGMTAIGLSHIDEKARVQDCLLKIQTASSHLMSLVNDVLDMSRIDSGRLTLGREPFSLPDLVHDIAVILRPQAAQKRQSLQLEIGRIHEENLIGDSLRVRQILVNIIGNAVKYTQEEGCIRVRFDQHFPEGVKAQRTAADTVFLDFLCQDNGMGMSPEFLERIFLPFERVHNEATSKIEGTGLGMSIVKNLIDRMDGQIRVESRLGEGSLFRITLPLGITAKSDDLSCPQNQTVLIAESGESLSDQLEECLRDCGMVPVVEKSGLSCVTYLTEAKYEDRMPCAMLLGQSLADMPCLELASHVRQLAGSQFPILLVSEADWAQIEYRASRAGVNAFVPCPLFKSRLLKTLIPLINAEQEETGSQCGTDYGSFHVLLVEDNELNQEIAVELLSMIGVQVETADDGAQAVAAFQASCAHHFDVIFMDVQMPVMNGYEATRRIRSLQRPDAETVRIVAMTANAFVEDIRSSKDAGMDEHLSKPVDLEHLQEILHRLLKSAPSQE
ncbi:MAG: response regulator [Lachnospiraceae bacterium]|nr:response regulator [Lachnospiraceae bacterium]